MENLKELFKSIEEQNEVFNTSSKAEKRVMIAQDCLVRIKLNQLKSNKGRMFTNNLFVNTDGDTSLKSLLNKDKNPLKCSVCAKGGLFMSYVGRVNECPVYDVSDDTGLNSKPMRKLLEIFSAKQLSLIETAFEGDTFSWNKTLSDNYVRKALRFFDRYNVKNRLGAICENIIENKGTFKP